MDQEELEETIKAQVEEWSSNSNESFNVEFVKGDGSTVAHFQPEFTYPIFGEEEAIFGYQGLSINLSYAAHDLRPHLEVSFDKKFKELGNVRPTDIKKALEDFLPVEAFSEDNSVQALEDEKASEFKPPGERISEYYVGGQKYEIWCASLDNAFARTLLERVQILVTMFIEGATVLELGENWSAQRWKVFFLYQVDAETSSRQTFSPYSLVGYSTSYRISTLPDRKNPVQSDLEMFLHSSQSIDSFLPPPDATSTNVLALTAMPNNVTSPLGLPCRERLSQFLILPPFQGSGHGQQLYNTMYSHLTSFENVREFTVEDPNESFDDLRDLCDLLYLRANHPDFAALRINIDIPPTELHKDTTLPTDLIVPIATRKKIITETKITQRQFDRLVEMHTLSFIPSSHRSRSRLTKKDQATNANDKSYYFWRLYVKRRLYIHNSDQLGQMEAAERVEKLESALDSVLEAYGEMLEKVQKREAERADVIVQGGGYGEALSTPRRPRKRKVVDEAEEDANGSEAEDDVEGDGTAPANGTKRPRV